MVTAALVDHSFGFGIESTFATGVTPNRFLEWTPGNALDFNPMVTQGAGIRQGSRFARAGRRVPVIGQGSGTIQADVLSKGFGLLWQWGIGTGVSNLLSAATYQQLFTTTLPNPTTMLSATIQEGIVQAQGTLDAYTHIGCTIGTLTLACSSSAPILTVSAEVDTKGLLTSTTYATPTYPATNAVTAFNFGALSASLGGTLVEPTTSTLASVTGSPLAANIRGITLALDNGIDNARWVPGSRRQPTSGVKVGTLTLNVEYDNVTGTLLRDAQLNQTSVGPGLFTWTGAALGVGVETLQITTPSLYVDSGAIPVPSDDNTIVTNVQFSVMDNLTNTQPLWVATRTADIAL